MAHINLFKFQLDKLCSPFHKIKKRAIQLHVNSFTDYVNLCDVSENISNTRKPTSICLLNISNDQIKIRKFCGKFRRRNLRKRKLKEVIIQWGTHINSYSRASHWTVLQATQKRFCYLLLYSNYLISKINKFVGNKIQASQKYSQIPD
jgi:hypothetical protein